MTRMLVTACIAALLGGCGPRTPPTKCEEPTFAAEPDCPYLGKN